MDKKKRKNNCRITKNSKGKRIKFMLIYYTFLTMKILTKKKKNE